LCFSGRLSVSVTTPRESMLVITLAMFRSLAI
jgi:hypothetical protein